MWCLLAEYIQGSRLKMINYNLVLFFVLLSKYHVILSKQCPPKHFILNGMVNCHSWLSCEDIPDVKIKQLIGTGGVKAVYLASWNDFNVVVSILNNPQYSNDFRSGLKLLQVLNPSPYIIQLIGFCDYSNVIITEYHPLGSAVNIIDFLKSKKSDGIISRLKLCLNYAEILTFLHSESAGKRVVCDSNDLNKLLSQFLIKEDFTLILNDLDALPQVTHNKSVKCGSRELRGSFVAPEQLWTLPGLFQDSLMPGYDEKTDIWKSVSVFTYFLRDVENNNVALYRLFHLHKRCKSVNPSDRPSANEIVEAYKEVIFELSNHEEL